MAYVVTPYVFEPPGPSFDLTLSEKAAWPKTKVSTANLADYPDRHEVLGLEFYINHRLYEGHGTHWNAKYYNRADDSLIFESDFDIPNPSTGGWTWWNTYRIFSWIGHCSWEINEPMNIRVDVTISSNIRPDFIRSFLFAVIKEMPEEEECPDFWVDPVGAVVCWITNAFQMLWGFTLGALKDAVLWIQAFQLSVTTEVLKFLVNPIKYIQDVVDSLIPILSDWWDDIISGVGDWWTTTKSDIGDWWSSASKAVGDWVDSTFSNIGSWWESVRSTVVDWMLGAWVNAATFWNDVTSKIGTWWDDTKDAIWNSIQSAITGLEAWIDSTKAGIGDWWDGVSTGIGEWWSDTIENLGNAWDDFVSGIGDVWDGIIKAIGDAIDTAVSNMETWVTDTVPGIVSSMFEWAKPIVKPIQDAVGFLGSIAEVFTGKRPKEPEIIEAELSIEEHKKAIKEIIGRLQ